MIILGIDPGVNITGYGVIEFDNGQMRIMEQGCIRIVKSEKFSLKLKTIYDGLCRIINIYHPEEFAIENVFYGENVQTALKIGHARGVAILAAINNGTNTPGA